MSKIKNQLVQLSSRRGQFLLRFNRFLRYNHLYMVKFKIIPSYYNSYIKFKVVMAIKCGSKLPLMWSCNPNIFVIGRKTVYEIDPQCPILFPVFKPSQISMDVRMIFNRNGLYYKHHQNLLTFKLYAIFTVFTYQ